MKRRFFAAVSGLVLAMAVSTAPVKADPVPTALGISAAVIVGANFIFDLPEYDTDKDFMNFGVGYFDGIDRDNTSAEFRLEYWAPFTWLKTRLIGGVFGTSDKGIGGYIALHHDMYLSENFVLSVESGPTLYAVGDGNHLGSYAVLRSGAGVGYRFDNSSRISLMLHHMSHGEIFSNRNPGVESISVGYAIPISALFGN